MAEGTQRPGLSGLAIAAAVCSIVTLLLLVADLVFHLGGASHILHQSGGWSSALLLAPGILGIAAAVRIALSGGKLGGWGFCLLGIITTVLGWYMDIAYAMSLLAWYTAT